jgi:hypothetical protein
MTVRSFPNPGNAPAARDNAVDIDHLLTLTNSRLFRLTGNPDVIGTRLGLRQLKRLGLASLVYGMPTEVASTGAPSPANDESAIA